MAINKNHEFGEVGELKCSIVEKNTSKERVTFLKDLLELNGFTVVVAVSPPPKVAPAPLASAGESAELKISNPEPQTTTSETYTVGVTNVSFNPTNAIFGRQLKTKSGHVVTLAYWEQKESVSHDEIPYFENGN